MSTKKILVYRVWRVSRPRALGMRMGPPFCDYMAQLFKWRNSIQFWDATATVWLMDKCLNGLYNSVSLQTIGVVSFGDAVTVTVMKAAKQASNV